MKMLINLIDRMETELNDAEVYAEIHLDYKTNRIDYDNSLLLIAQEKLNLAKQLHTLALKKIDEMEQKVSLNQQTLDLWKYAHNKYTEKTTWIKKILEF